MKKKEIKLSFNQDWDGLLMIKLFKNMRIKLKNSKLNLINFTFCDARTHSAPKMMIAFITEHYIFWYDLHNVG